MRITVSDIRKAVLNGDASSFAAVLRQALGGAPIPTVSSLERPLILPEMTVLLKPTDNELELLLTSWLEGKACEGEPPENPDLILMEVAPYGKNVGDYLQRVVNEVNPDAMALDVPPINLLTNMVYAMSLPSACGLVGYGEVRTEGIGKPLSREIFYPGSMSETVIITSWLGKIPLIPVGMPAAPESGAPALADEDVADEEMSGLRLRAAYGAFDEALKAISHLTAGIETGEKIGRSLANTLSIHMTRKLEREAQYSASRITDIASFLKGRGRAARILAVADIKHSLELRRALHSLFQGITENVYQPPRSYAVKKAVMMGRHSLELNDYVKEFLPVTTLTQELFGGALSKASSIRQKEEITEAVADELTSQMVQRTRIHPLIARGASVRGSIAMKELISGLCQLQPALTRDVLEKAALITLPPRITLKPGVKESKIAIVSDITKEILYDISFLRTVYEITLTDNALFPSLEDFAESLDDLSQKIEEKQPAKSEMTIVASKKNEDKLLKALEAGKLLRKSRRSQFSLSRKSVERLLANLRDKLKSGDISEDRYEGERARLEEMFPGIYEPQYPLSKKELSELIMDFMDAVDKQIEKEWGKDINFLRMYAYYQMRAERGEGKNTQRNRSHMELKFLIDDLEKRGLLKRATPGGDRTPSGLALNLLMEYLEPRDPRLRHLKENMDGRRAQIIERMQEVRRFGTGGVFRDISFRHTLKEIARQKKTVKDVRRSDFRIYRKHRHKEHADIVLCVDTSGSMAEARKIIYARLAAGVIADEAQATGDRVGIVAFDDLGQTALPLEDENLAVINDYIVALSALGATNIGDGIRCAIDLLLNEPSGSKKRIILLTDGEPNAITEKAFAELKGKSAGDLTQESALIETRRASAQGITVSVVYLTDGKGTGGEFVRNIARAGRGRITTITCHDE